MKVEKSSYIEIYNVETDDYNIAIQYQQYFNILFAEWEIISIQDKNGLDVELLKDDIEELKDGIVKIIVESEN